MERLYGMGVNNNKNTKVVEGKRKDDSDEEVKPAKKITREEFKEMIGTDEHNKNLERLEQIKRKREMAAR